MHSGTTPLAAKRRWVVWHATLGLGFGFAVLHPVSMLIVRLFEPGVHSAQRAPVTVIDALEAMARAFEAEMVPMGLVFGVFTAGLGAVNGWYRITAAIQRNRLAHQLDLTRRYRSELEELVQRLWGQNARLAQLEQAKRRTTQFMVHDFKTHLGCIMGYSELLLKRVQGRWAPEDIDALTRIRRQGARMTAAVTDLLEFARLQEAGAPRKESVSAEEILRQVSEDLSLPDHFKNVELGPRHKTCPPLWVDPRLTRRALSNLVANALKHNPVGTEVVIDAQPSAENRREVLFMCRDDGRGIPPDKVPTIFDEFNGGSEESTGDSTGLGLAFCRAAVEAHGGRIWCESTLGKGTCFFFTVPTSEEAAGRSLVGSADERRVQ